MKERIPYTSGREEAMGLSLRDFFAANAVNGILASEDCETEINQFRKISVPTIAENAYLIADAMLIARSKKG